MSDTPNAASAADTSQAAKPAELKSTDTGTFSKLTAETPKSAAPAKATPSPKAEPKTEAPPKAEKDANSDADPAAEHPDGPDRLEPWMRKRLSRAEEKGRKQALAEFSQLLGSQPQPNAQAPQPQQDERPALLEAPKSLADFDNDIEQYADYLAERKVEKAFAKRDQDAANKAKEAKAHEARTVFEKRASEFEQKTGVTWEDVISVEVDIPQEVVELINGHPRDLYLGHYLVTNPAILDELRGKSRLEIATRLAEIDRTLAGDEKPAAAPAPKAVPQAVKSTRELPPKTTKAPAPPADLPSGSASTKSIENMTTEERIAEWRKQKAARNR